MNLRRMTVSSFALAALISCPCTATYGDNVFRTWTWIDSGGNIIELTLTDSVSLGRKVKIKAKRPYRPPTLNLPERLAYEIPEVTKPLVTAKDMTGVKAFRAYGVSGKTTSGGTTTDAKFNILIAYAQQGAGDTDDLIVIQIIRLPAGYAAPVTEYLPGCDRCGRPCYYQRWVCQLRIGNPCDPDEEILIPNQT